MSTEEEATKSVAFSDSRSAPAGLDGGERRQHQHRARMVRETAQGRREAGAAVFHPGDAGPRAEADEVGAAPNRMSETSVAHQVGGEGGGGEDPAVVVRDQDHLPVGALGRQRVAEDVLDAGPVPRGDRVRRRA